jgi:hypothetical protein
MKKQAINNPNAQKQEICSSSLQSSLRCKTLAFLPPARKFRKEVAMNKESDLVLLVIIF